MHDVICIQDVTAKSRITVHEPLRNLRKAHVHLDVKKVKFHTQYAEIRARYLRATFCFKIFSLSVISRLINLILLDNDNAI